jgi:hypothetical protein
MNQIRITTKYTVEDYIRTETFLKNLRSRSSIIINLGIFIILLAVLADLYIFYDLGGERVLVFLLFLLSLFVVYFLIPFYYQFFNGNPLELILFKRNIKKNFDPDSIAYVERRIVFDDEGITETHKFGNHLTNWEDISEVIETNEDFYFYLDSTIRFQPKRDFLQEEIDKLRILIKTNLREDAGYQVRMAN